MLSADVEPVEPLLEVTFDIVDGLHLGAEPDGNHRPLYRRNGSVVIEGSTLKGIVRSRAEYILRTVAGDAGICCDSSTAPCAVCPTCELFGSPEHRGRLRFLSSPIEDPVIEDRRMHVAIDRVSGGATDRLLFSEEVVLSGRFHLRVEAEVGVPDWAANLLRAAVRDMHDGYVGVGSDTARGLGTVRALDPPPVDFDLLRRPIGAVA